MIPLALLLMALPLALLLMAVPLAAVDVLGAVVLAAVVLLAAVAVPVLAVDAVAAGVPAAFAVVDSSFFCSSPGLVRSPLPRSLARSKGGPFILMKLPICFFDMTLAICLSVWLSSVSRCSRLFS